MIPRRARSVFLLALAASAGAATPAAIVTPEEPALGDTRERIDGLLGRPTLVRHGDDGSDTARYVRGVVVYRGGKAVELRVESAEKFAAREAEAAQRAVDAARAAAAKRAARTKEDNAARDDLIWSTAFRRALPAAKLAALDRLLAYHPYAEIAGLKERIVALKVAAPDEISAVSRLATTTFADVIRARFTAWDLDGDGRLEPEEIDRLMLRTDIVGDDAAALVSVKGFQRRVTLWRQGRFAPTEAELIAPGLAISDPAGSAESRYELAAVFPYYRAAMARIRHGLFADALPDFARLAQGDAGNCCFFATLGAMAKGDPARIRDMFTQNDDGGFNVRLGTGENLVVSPRSDARLIQNTGARTLTDGVWVPVLEEAVSRRLVVRSGGDAPTDSTEVVVTGGSPEPFIRLLCGRSGTMYVLHTPFSRESTMAALGRDIGSALAAKRVVVATMTAQPPVNTAPIPGIVYSHAYAVIGYDEGARRVTLWNPWANDFAPQGPEGTENGYATSRGVFTLPLADLYDRFGNVFFESR